MDPPLSNSSIGSCRAGSSHEHLQQVTNSLQAPLPWLWEFMPCIICWHWLKHSCMTHHPKRLDTRVTFNLLSCSQMERCQSKALDKSTSWRVSTLALSKRVETYGRLQVHVQTESASMDERLGSHIRVLTVSANYQSHSWLQNIDTAWFFKCNDHQMTEFDVLAAAALSMKAVRSGGATNRAMTRPFL